MQIVKKNIVSIIFGVIAIIAIAFAFYPMGGKFDELNQQLADRAAKFKTAQGFLAKKRFLPQAHIGAEEQTPLTVFPTPVVTNLAKAFIKALISQSEGVFKAALDMNLAECRMGANGQMLLLANSLPLPSGSRDAEFKKALPPEAEYLRLKVLNSTTPPTADELTKEDARILAENNLKLVRGPDGNAINEQKVTEAYQKESAGLEEKMRNERATNNKMYADPGALMPPAEIMQPSQAPSSSAIWYAQAGLWVQEDVCRAISEVNKESKTVLESPIKRLVRLDIKFGPEMYARAAPAGASPSESGAGRPGEGGGHSFDVADPSLANNNPPTRNFTFSPTGRTSNAMYDVVTFQLEIHVDVTRIPQILKQLSRNRFISVRKMEARRVEPSEITSVGFVYGGAPVVDLVLDCEMLQLREWSYQWMPAEVKKTLGVPADFQPTLSKKTP